MEKQNKYIFAAYLNMARQNAYMILKHISTLMGIENNTDEQSLSEFTIIRQLRTKSVKPEVKSKTKKLLHKHFPFLQAIIDYEMSQANKNNNKDIDLTVQAPANYADILTRVFKLLNYLRNETTHYAHYSEKDLADEQKKIAEYLYHAFDGARRVVKERFEDVTEQDMGFLTGKSRYETKTEDVTDKNGEIIYLKNGRKKTKTIFTKEENKSYKYSLKKVDGDNVLLSDVGLTMFICLFLHKKYISEFLDQVKPYGNEPEADFLKAKYQKEKKIIREIFSVYRIRLPKDRLDSTRPDYSLGLDMLNELQKCPKELYETLSDQKKKTFRIELRDKAKAKTDDDEVLLMRHDDRFPYFALRYIDDNKLFNGIRFQVSLGKYRYKFYDKKCIDSTNDEDTTVRSLQKEINGFGRLAEIEQQRVTRWAKDIRTFEKIAEDTPDTKPYITDQHASYAFTGNRIGMLFNYDGSATLKNGLYMPSLTFVKDGDGKDAACVAPTCWLSVYELPALIFYQYLRDKYAREKDCAEKIIKDCVAKYRDIFSRIASGICDTVDAEGNVVKKELSADIIFKGFSGQRIERTATGRKLNKNASAHFNEYLHKNYAIESKDLPEKLIKFLSGTLPGDHNEEIAKAEIERMIKSTTKRQRDYAKAVGVIGTKENKLGKKRHEDIRPGTLARFLAKDLLRFQPPHKVTENGKTKVVNKLTGLNFQKLQENLATYQVGLSGLRNMMKSSHLIDCEYCHPFLEKVLNNGPKSTAEFYRIYLEQRIAYLESLMKNPVATELHFLHLDRKQWRTGNADFYKTLVNRYLNDNPIELPRGLFTEHIKALLEENFKDVSFDGKQEWANATFLIDRYFTAVLGDDSQPFYNSTDFRRTYKAFNVLQNQVERNKLVEQFYDIDKMTELAKGCKEKYISREEKAIKDYIDRKSPRLHYTSNLLKDDTIGDIAKELKKDDADFRDRLKYDRLNDYNFDKVTKTIIEVYVQKASKKMTHLLLEYKSNEKTLRRYRVQDMITFLLAKELLLSKQIGEASEGINKSQLKDIIPGNKHSVLSVPIPFSITLNLGDGKSYTISQTDLKVKNYGDFFQFIYDDRVKTLLPLVKKAEVDRDVLEEELENYDTKRVQVFELVHLLEKKALEQNSELAEETGEKPVRNNFKDLACTLSNWVEQDLSLLIEVRNAVGHNRYPEDKFVNYPENIDIPDVASEFNKKAAKIATKIATSHIKK